MTDCNKWTKNKCTSITLFAMYVELTSSTERNLGKLRKIFNIGIVMVHHSSQTKAQINDGLLYSFTCLESCSSQSLYRVKNLRASSMLSLNPQLASFTLMMIWRSGTVMATERNLSFRFSGSSWRPA